MKGILGLKVGAKIFKLKKSITLINKILFSKEKNVFGILGLTQRNSTFDKQYFAIFYNFCDL